MPFRMLSLFRIWRMDGDIGMINGELGLLIGAGGLFLRNYFLPLQNS